MNLSRKLLLFLLLQALIFAGTVASFVYYDIYPAYFTLEKTIGKHTLTPESQILLQEEQAELKLYKTLKESVQNFLLIFIVLGIFFTIGALLFMNFLILKPIHTLQKQMHWIIRNKKFRPIHQVSKTTDEFADLTKYFNSLIEHVIQQNKALEDLSLTDPLTLLQNRRSLDQFITTLGGLLKREVKNISIIMIDIDHFKLYNDTYGHIQGDDVIKKVAQTIMHNASRLSDFVARYGGEEFVVIFPDTPIEGAKAIAENIRQDIENYKIPHNTSVTTGKISVSIGASSALVSDKNQLIKLLEDADDALYHAKFDGRNRVSVHITNNNQSKSDLKKDNS